MVRAVKTLITGGTGALGLELARLLAARGDTLVLFDAAPRPLIATAFARSAAVVQGDLANWADVVATLHDHRPDRIFHLGALLPSACEANAAAAFAVNAQGTVTLLEAARLLGPQQVVMASSTSIISAARGGETAPSMYGATKYCAEIMAETYHGRDGLDVRGVRLPPIMGLHIPYFRPRETPGASPNSDLDAFAFRDLATVASTMLHEVALHGACAVPAAETTSAPVMYRRDAVRALALLAAAPDATLRSRFYAVLGAEPVMTLGELAAALRAEIAGASITFQPTRDAPVIDADAARSWDEQAREEWGWQAAFTARAIVRDAVAETRRYPHLYASH